MPTARDSLLTVRGVVKRYSALRPLRIASLTIAPQQRTAIVGLDAAAAELVINLLTGATLPDEGEIILFGRSTAALESEAEWFGALDRLGIVSHRAVLLEQLTIAQNLAMPLTLDIDPILPDVVPCVARLAAEVGVGEIDQRLEEAAPERRGLVHLARAIALNPELLLLEHPTVSLSEEASSALGDTVVRVAERRGMAILALTDNRRFAKRVAGHHLMLQAATGILKEGTGLARWF